MAPRSTPATPIACGCVVANNMWYATRCLVGLLAVSAGVVGTAGPAAAPSPFASAWEAQTALGYEPCRPAIEPLPLSRVADGFAADADNGEQSGRCVIRVAWDLPDELLNTIAWHEVCHLSTGVRIFADPDSAGLVDPWHHSPLFTQCLAFGPAEHGGY